MMSVFFFFVLLIMSKFSSSPIVVVYGAEEQQHNNNEDDINNNNKFAHSNEAGEEFSSENNAKIKTKKLKNRSYYNMKLQGRMIADGEDDDRTLLDIFGEVAKEYFTQKVIPPTDAECRWDWRSMRCEPYCLCNYIPCVGDYHIGRSCRLNPTFKEKSQEEAMAICRSERQKKKMKSRALSNNKNPIHRRFMDSVTKTAKKINIIRKQLFNTTKNKLHDMKLNFCSNIVSAQQQSIASSTNNDDENENKEELCIHYNEFSTPERLLCSKHIKLPICDDFELH